MGNIQDSFDSKTVVDIVNEINMCQQEIKRFVILHPEIEEKIGESFIKLKNTCLSKVLYRQHVNELLKRILNNKPLDNLTDAEVLAIMSKVNQFISLPGNEFTTAIRMLFSRLMPENDSIVIEICKGLEERAGSKWEDEAQLIIDKIKSKFKIEFRK